MNIYFVMLFGGILGIILHTFKSVNDIRKRLLITTPNVKFKTVFVEFWSSEWLALVGSLICYGTLLFVASEFANLKAMDTTDPTESLKDRLLHFNISNFIKTSSVIAGYFSDSLVYGFLGKTEQSLKEKFDNPKP